MNVRDMAMLDLRPNCECCDRDLPAGSPEARICSYECTFCRDCAPGMLGGVLGGVWPNCGGELVRRPDPSARAAVVPPGLAPAGCEAGRLRPRAGDARLAIMALGPSRRGLVPPFIAMDVLRAANEREAAGHSVIHLEVGQPGTPAPAAVLDAARAALAADRIGYTDALGIMPLRAAIAGHYREQYGVAVDPAEVVVTTGSSAAFQLAFLAAFEAGDRVALAAPGYPAYRNILAALGLEPVLIEVGENAHYQPNPELLAEAGDIAGLIVASPANPTGTMIPPGELACLAAWCRERGIRLVSDEIYHGITYENPAQTARAFGPGDQGRAIIVNSFSKYYSMTGWRLGWMVVPPDLARSVECLAQNFYISPPTLSQLAALPVFGCRAELDSHVARYRANRDVLIATLSQAGFDHFAPAEGAFYLYVDVSAVTRDSVEFCRRMLAETGVATTPGRDFDPDPRRQLAAPLLRRRDRRHRRSRKPIGRMAAARRLISGGRQRGLSTRRWGRSGNSRRLRTGRARSGRGARRLPPRPTKWRARGG